MAENIHEDIERVEVAPAEAGENVELPDGPEAPAEAVAEDPDEHSQAEKPQGAPQEHLVTQQPAKPLVKKEPAPVEGETPRERALRQKVETLEKAERDRTATALAESGRPATAPATQLTPEEEATLKGFESKEVAALQRVLPILAKQAGFVKSEDLTQKQYGERALETITAWVDEHPEYKDQTLWNRVREISDTTYKPPLNPKDWTKILNRIHAELSGIEPIGDKGAITAARQKITVASHAGTSAPARTTPQAQRKVSPSGLRLDGLSGFSEEELKEIEDRAAG